VNETLPTVLQDAVVTLSLSRIPVDVPALNRVFKSRISAALSLEELTRLKLARKLLTKFINTGTFTFHCANCRYLSQWNTSLYIEINNVLLCKTCMQGLEAILEKNPDFKTEAQLNREATAATKEAEQEAAYRKRMEDRNDT